MPWKYLNLLTTSLKEQWKVKCLMESSQNFNLPMLKSYSKSFLCRVNIWCVIDYIHQQNLWLSAENTKRKVKKKLFSKSESQLQISTNYFLYNCTIVLTTMKEMKKMWNSIIKILGKFYNSKQKLQWLWAWLAS